MRLLWLLLSLVMVASCQGDGTSEAAAEEAEASTPDSSSTWFLDGLTLELSFAALELEGQPERLRYPIEIVPTARTVNCFWLDAAHRQRAIEEGTFQRLGCSY